MKTSDNVMSAFTGESQANRKYATFAEKAAEEGFPAVARLFKAASEAEAIHARRLMKVMGAIGTTADNLEKAVAGETHEYTEMYPGFIATAKVEGGQSEAEIAFNYAKMAEEVHAGLYKKALDAVNGKRDLPADKVSVCTICGNIFLGEAPPQCPICKAFKKKFVEVS
ncbi:MAG: rubrerythrin [Methanomicrobia archaeon]|jgi:rubrerythrin|nr:rubrerythrin [Methanomicrobia archaeon]MDD1646411.1 rubrerythrin family protein [Methanomicrobiales archaeon]